MSAARGPVSRVLHAGMGKGDAHKAVSLSFLAARVLDYGDCFFSISATLMASPLASVSSSDAGNLVACFVASGPAAHCDLLPGFVESNLPSLGAFALTFSIISLIWRWYGREMDRVDRMTRWVGVGEGCGLRARVLACMRDLPAQPRGVLLRVWGHARCALPSRHVHGRRRVHRPQRGARRVLCEHVLCDGHVRRRRRPATAALAGSTMAPPPLRRLYWAEQTVYAYAARSRVVLNALRRRSLFQLVVSLLGLSVCIIVSVHGFPRSSVAVFVGLGALLVAARTRVLVLCAPAAEAAELAALLREEKARGRHRTQLARARGGAHCVKIQVCMRQCERVEAQVDEAFIDREKLEVWTDGVFSTIATLVRVCWGRGGGADRVGMCVLGARRR